MGKEKVIMLSPSQRKALELLAKGWAVDVYGYSYIRWEVRLQTRRSLAKLGYLEFQGGLGKYGTKRNNERAKITNAGYVAIGWEWRQCLKCNKLVWYPPTETRNCSCEEKI